MVNLIKIQHLQEENRILEKTNRQKVLEVEKLSQTIQELEEVVLAAGAAANAVRDHKRQIEELNVSSLQYLVFYFFLKKFRHSRFEMLTFVEY